MRSGRSTGSGRMKKPFTSEKDALVAAMPSASVPTSTAVTIGVLSCVRKPKTRSCQRRSSHRPTRTSRTRSFTCSTPSSSNAAARRALGGREAGVDLFLDQELEVRTDVGVERPLHVIAAQQVPPQRREPRREHRHELRRGLEGARIASAIRCQLSVSAFSCFRPDLVSR